MPSTSKLHTQSGSHCSFLPKKKRSSFAWQHSQVSPAAQGITQGSRKCHRPSHMQGEAVFTRVQMRPGSTAAWMCSFGVLSCQEGIRGGQSSDGRGWNQGSGNGAGLVASKQSPNEPGVCRKPWNLGAEEQQCPAGGLGSAPSSQSLLSSSDKLAGAAHSLPAFLQSGFPNQSIKKPSKDMAVNRKAPSSAGRPKPGLFGTAKLPLRSSNIPEHRLKPNFQVLSVVQGLFGCPMQSEIPLT